MESDYLSSSDDSLDYPLLEMTQLKRQIELKRLGSSLIQNIPAMTTSNTTMPTVATTNTNIPSVTTRTFTMPAVSTTNCAMPSVTTTTITLPAVTINNSTMPSVTVNNSTMPAMTSAISTLPAVTINNSTMSSVTTTITTMPSVITTISTMPSVTSTISTMPSVTSTMPAVTVNNSTMPSVTTTNSTMPSVASINSTMPSVTSTISTMPSVTSTIFTMPSVTSTISTMPAVTINNSTMSSVTNTISTMPSVTSTISTMPAVTINNSTMSSVTTTISTMPSVTTTISTMPSVTSTMPAVTVNNSTMPSVTTTNSTMPSVTSTISTMPSVTSTMPALTINNSAMSSVTVNNSTMPSVASINSIMPSVTINNSTMPSVTINNSPMPGVSTTNSVMPSVATTIFTMSAVTTTMPVVTTTNSIMPSVTTTVFTSPAMTTTNTTMPSVTSTNSIMPSTTTTFTMPAVTTTTFNTFVTTTTSVMPSLALDPTTSFGNGCESPIDFEIIERFIDSAPDFYLSNADGCTDNKNSNWKYDKRPSKRKSAEEAEKRFLNLQLALLDVESDNNDGEYYIPTDPDLSDSAPTKNTNSDQESSFNLCDENNRDDLILSDDRHQEPKQKRRKTVKERDQTRVLREESIKLKYSLKPGCPRICKKKCCDRFSEDERQQINSDFWDLDWSLRRMFVLQCVSKKTCDSQTGKEKTSRKKATFSYNLRKPDGLYDKVCKTFFLTTLGFKPKNDSIITECFKSVKEDKQSVQESPKDQRGHHIPTHKVDHAIIMQHIEKYNPAVPHYRREHAPNRRYIPSDVTIVDMHQNFVKTAHSARLRKITYELYRSVLEEMNISFALLGGEECEECAKGNIHKLSCTVENNECAECIKLKKHIERSAQARLYYRADAEKKKKESEIIVSADLQKIIMLPRLDQYKSGLFTRRISAMNETFAYVGESKTVPGANRINTVCLWHEGISGRRDEDIASAFWEFLKKNRDAKKVVFWLDNCSGQNKNWTLITVLAAAVNSDHLINTDEIVLRYFEPGHTFMSADSVHHSIEREMKKMGKVFDFNDFISCAKNAGCETLVMNHDRFVHWQSGTSQYKLKKATDRPYLADLSTISFKRGSNSMFYKSWYGEDEKEFEFIRKHFTLTTEQSTRTKPRGIRPDKKMDIITKLVPLMPVNRRTFWQELPIDDSSLDLTINTDY